MSFNKRTLIGDEILSASIKGKRVKSIDYYKSFLETLKKTPETVLYPFEDELFSELIKVIKDESGSTEKQLVILCGPSGSGKSSVIRGVLTELGINNAVNIDTDEVRQFLMEMARTNPILPLSYDEESLAKYRAYSEVATLYNKRLLDRSFKDGRNIIYDTTCRLKNGYATLDLLNTAKDQGYTSTLVIIYASLQTCIDRVRGRNESIKRSSSGRITLDERVVEGIYKDFNSSIAKNVVGNANPDKLFLYSNDAAGEPKLLYYKDKTGVIETPFLEESMPFYNMIVHKKGDELYEDHNIKLSNSTIYVAPFISLNSLASKGGKIFGKKTPFKTIRKSIIEHRRRRNNKTNKKNKKNKRKNRGITNRKRN
jgi:predicted ABC-type ATPase